MHGWERLGITAENENEGKGTGTGNGKIERRADNDGKGTGTGKGKGKGKYTWEQFLYDEYALFTQLERHVSRGESGGALARVIARVLFVSKGKAFAKGKAEGKGKVEVQIEGADDNNDEADFIKSIREGQARREEPPPPIALPYVPPTMRDGMTSLDLFIEGQIEGAETL